MLRKGLPLHEWMNENLYIMHKKLPHKTLRVHSTRYTPCMHVSSCKLKLPKVTHNKKYKQQLPTHPFPKVELYIAVKCKNKYSITNNDNRKKNHTHTHTHTHTPWDHAKQNNFTIQHNTLSPLHSPQCSEGCRTAQHPGRGTGPAGTAGCVQTWTTGPLLTPPRSSLSATWSNLNKDTPLWTCLLAYCQLRVRLSFSNNNINTVKHKIISLIS